MAWSGNRKQRIKRKVLVTNASCIGSHSFERTCAAGCEFFLLLSFCPLLHRPAWLSRRAINARDFTTPSVNGGSRRFVPSPTSADAGASQSTRAQALVLVRPGDKALQHDNDISTWVFL